MTMATTMAGAMLFVMSIVVIIVLWKAIPYIFVGCLSILAFWLFLKIGLPLLYVGVVHFGLVH